MVVIEDVYATRERRQEVIRSRVRVDDQETALWFKWNGVACPSAGDLLLLATVAPAMRRGFDLDLTHHVSQEMLDSLSAIQQHFQYRDPDLLMIDVYAEPLSQDGNQGVQHSAGKLMGTGILFDGSVDAFFTYINNQEQIDTIVFVSDYEDDKEIQQGKGTAIKSVERRAGDLGKPLIRVETNLRQFLRTFNNEPQFDQALVIAVIDVLLSGQLTKLVIPGVGGQPMNDVETEDGICAGFISCLPTTRIYVDHAGSGVEHSVKIESLKTSNTTLDALRVCWENPDRGYNCGRCKKCTRRVSPARLVELLNRESKLIQQHVYPGLQET